MESPSIEADGALVIDAAQGYAHFLNREAYAALRGGRKEIAENLTKEADEILAACQRLQREANLYG